MFEIESRKNTFMRFAISFTCFQYTLILISGLILGSAGLYAAWLDINGRYQELGLAFFFWLPFHFPVYLVALDLPRDFYFPITFAWWFFIGGSTMFIVVFLEDYLRSLVPE